MKVIHIQQIKFFIIAPACKYSSFPVKISKKTKYIYLVMIAQYTVMIVCKYRLLSHESFPGNKHE